MSIDNLGIVIAETTMKAAAEILRAQGRTRSTVDLDALTDALRIQARAAVPRILDQGKALLDSGNPGWLEALVITECHEAAKAAIAGL